MQKLLKTFSSLFPILFIIGIPTIMVQANGEGTTQIKAIIPDNQIQDNIGYFDLMMVPGQKQTIEVELDNSSSEEKNYFIHITPATTSDGGTIDYSNLEPTLDESVPFDFREIATLEKEKYVVPPNSKIRVPIQLSMPEEAFEGRLLGGIYSYVESDDEESMDEALQVKNKVSNSIAIVLRVGDSPVTPNLVLKQIIADSRNTFPIIEVNLQNPTPTIIGGLSIDSTVYYEDNLYIENHSENMIMAPNSNFDYGLPLDGQEIQPGNYRLEMTASSGEHTWEFSEEFAIDSQTANHLNENIVFEVEKDNHYLYYIIFGLIILIVMILLVFFIKKYKKSESEKQ